MSLLDYANSKEGKELAEKQHWDKIVKFACENNHTLYRDSPYCYGYILTDNITKKQYYFDRVATNYPNSIFNQISINKKQQETKKIDPEWLHEKDKYKRRKIYARKYYIK